MELQVAERVSEDQLQPLSHIPVTCVPLERVVPEVGVPEFPVEDLSQAEVADDRAVLVPADDESGAAPLDEAGDMGPERLSRRRGM